MQPIEVGEQQLGSCTWSKIKKRRKKMNRGKNIQAVVVKQVTEHNVVYFRG